MTDEQKTLSLSQPLETGAGSSKIHIPTCVDNWEEYFLHIARAVSIKSKDPRCSVGAVIVSHDNIVLSTGYNGLARGVHDDVQILMDADEKLKIICHAENNAIMNAARVGGHPLEGTTMYVTKFPCLACCNAIIQSGIKRICTHDHEFWRDDPFDADHSRKPRLLHEARVEVFAPFHPAYMPSEQITVPKKSPAAKPSPKKALPKETMHPSIDKMGWYERVVLGGRTIDAAPVTELIADLFETRLGVQNVRRIVRI